MRKTASLFITCLFILLPAVSPAAAASASSPAALLISELQTGGCTDGGAPACGEEGKMEFIELYNPDSAALPLQNWKVDYVSASGATTTTLAVLNGTVSAHGYLLLAYAGYYSGAEVSFGATDTKSSGMLAKTGGSVQIVDDGGAIIDLVGWGSGTARVETTAAKAPGAGQSLQRKAADGVLADTGNNAQDLIIAAVPTPQGGGYSPAAAPAPVSEIPPPPGGNPSPAGITCEGVLLSELLPNPGGTDTGHEFIELYNPTGDIIPLDNCSLQTTGSQKVYGLTGNLAAGAYLALYSDKTGLTLPNAAGGSVWLLTRTDELQAVSYPGALADDVAWARFDDGWQQTHKPTPGMPNALVTQAACPDGQYRSDTTGRCRSNSAAAAASSDMKPCQQGQERNPATNRCHSVLDILTGLQPCKDTQERNPSTNRCRSVLGASTVLKPCAAGQTRNPATNRCRKDTGTTPATVKDVPVAVAAVTTPVPWIIAIVAVIAALGYGVYEWRQELLSVAAGLRGWLAARLPGLRGARK